MLFQSLAFGVARGDTVPVMCIVAAAAAVWLPAWYWLERPFARDGRGGRRGGAWRAATT